MTATRLAARRTIVAPVPPHGGTAQDDPPWPGLEIAAARLGVPLDETQIGHFSAYRDLLVARNARTNLTAIREPAEVERRLFFDALRMIPALDDAVASSAAEGRARLVDVGSGAGFPGLALKIARPDLDVTLIEATGKKVAFLQEVVETLDLNGVVAVHGRAEELGHRPEHRGVYGVATARAVAALPALVELCVPFLRIGGHGLFPKGAAIGEEMRAAERAAPVVGARVLGAVPMTEDSLLVRVRKTGPTPERYPRRAGLPAREPLGSGAHRDERGPRPRGSVTEERGAARRGRADR